MASDIVKHYPVLLKEVISIISPQHGGTFIDCTFGQGGYAEEILQFKNTKIIGLDRDKESQIAAKRLLKKFPERFIFKNIKFSKLNNLKLKKENIKGIIFDLGYSLTQMKDKKKGLSFNFNGKLNMQLGQNDFSAYEVINKLDDKDLNTIFKFFGDEKESRAIAKNIVKERKFGEIDTQKLVQLIEKTKFRKNFKTHSATKIFQALRIFVNKEISELIFGLVNAAKILKKDGILAVVSFHSLEDRIVKYFFRSLTQDKSFSRYVPKLDRKKFFFKMPINKPIVPSEKELANNSSSRSAKLRFIIKKENIYEIESDIENQFRELLKIENLSQKL